MRKTVLLIILFSCFFRPSNAQTFSELHQMSVDAYQKGDYQSAIQYGERLKEMVEKEIRVSDADHIIILDNLAAFYTMNGDFRKAEETFSTVIKKSAEVYGEDHPDHATCLFNLAGLYLHTGRPQEAEPLLLKVLSISKKYFDTKPSDYIAANKTLGTLYYEAGNYGKSDSIFTTLIAISGDIYGPGHPEYISFLVKSGESKYQLGRYEQACDQFLVALSFYRTDLSVYDDDYFRVLIDIAITYTGWNRFPEAKVYCMEAINFSKGQWGITDKNYAKAINNLAFLYKTTGEFSEALPLLAESLEIQKKEQSEYDETYSSTLNNLAGIYKATGEYSKAEDYYNDALMYNKKYLGQNSIYYYLSMNNLASLFIEAGRNLDEAEEMLTSTLQNIERMMGKHNIYYPITLNNLAQLFNRQGRSGKAASMLDETSEILKNMGKDFSPEYGKILINTGSLFKDIGSYKKAESLLITGLEVLVDQLGPYHPDCSSSLVKLGSLYFDLYEYESAGKAYEKALEIYLNSTGKKSVPYAETLSLLASIYKEQGFYEKSEILYKESLSIFKEISGIKSPGYQVTQHNMASMFQKKGDLYKAREAYQNSLEFFKDIYGPGHPQYTTALKNLAVLCWEQGDLKNALSYFNTVNENLCRDLEDNFIFLTEEEKGYFLNILMDYNFDQIYSFFTREKILNLQHTGIIYNDELLRKGLLLQNTAKLKQSVYNSNDALLINDYERLTSIRTQIRESNFNSERWIPETTDSLESLAEKLERDLILRAKNMPDAKIKYELADKTWPDVQNSLDEDEAAVEFIKFRYFDKEWSDSIFYYALVLKKGMEYPAIFYLFEESELTPVFSHPGATRNPFYITQMYSHKPEYSTMQCGKDTVNLLYQSIWEPIDSILKGVTSVYLAPSGLLHKVSFAALPSGSEEILADKYQINMISSTRLLAGMKNENDKMEKGIRVALYGGIEYEIDSTEWVGIVRGNNIQDEKYTAGNNLEIPLEIRGFSWDYLPGTLNEVLSIGKIFTASENEVKLYTGKSATEESLRDLTGMGTSPDIVHIASHGFFFPEVKQSVRDIEISGSFTSNTRTLGFRRSDDPLLRSGILMAGAGRIWNDLNPLPGVEDGTLTAAEVSELNMENTRLVVLSACETGLGDIKGIEGVYGLQRAFKMAGVRFLIMSLWQVPDYQTSELMQLFYRNLNTGLGIRDSFAKAQEIMREKYSAFNWAGFILIE